MRRPQVLTRHFLLRFGVATGRWFRLSFILHVPIGSMCGTSISTYIWLVFMVNVGQVNIPCMDPMGYGLRITGPLIASDKCRYLYRTAGTVASWQLAFQWWNSAIENSRKQETIITSLYSGWFGSVVMISFHVPTSCTIGSVTFTNEPLSFCWPKQQKKKYTSVLRWLRW